MLPFRPMNPSGIGELSRAFGNVFYRCHAGGAEDFTSLIVAVVGAPAECKGYYSSYKGTDTKKSVGLCEASLVTRETSQD